MQVAVFRGLNLKSSVTSYLNSKEARGGIRCEVSLLPQMPKSRSFIRNGEWEESYDIDPFNHEYNFLIDFDASDQASSQLVSMLRNNKNIEEIVVYELMNTNNSFSYGYYFNKVFVKRASTGGDANGHKVIRLECACVSFKERDQNNNEPVLWDSESMSHSYSGQIR